MSFIQLLIKADKCLVRQLCLPVNNSYLRVQT